jgi:hypothetical protein
MHRFIDHLAQPSAARRGRFALPLLASLALALPVTAAASIHTLRVEKAGSGSGAVTSSPAGIECGSTCQATFPEGQAVTLTGVPDSGSQAVQWSGCDSVTTENACLVSMTFAKNVTATFKLGQHQLTVGTTGVGTGTVTSSPAGIECGTACAASFTHGSVVTLKGAPGLHSLPPQWVGCDSVNPKDECLVTMSEAKAVTATFDLEPGYALYALTVEKRGNGAGTVTSSLGSIECGAVCSGEFLTKTKVTLTATASPGSAFKLWGGACTGTGVCEVTLGKAKTVFAKFIAVGQRTLTISKAGTGTGTVVSHPAGIACGTTCSAQIAAEKLISLTSTPAPDSTFAGFSGACSGTGVCKVLMSEARSVTASFTKAPTPPSTGTAVVAGKAKVKGGKALIKILCQGPSSCRGSLRLTAKLGGKKSVAIGTATFNLAPGSSTTLKVTLSAAAKQRLAGTGHLRARVSGAGVTSRSVRVNR